MTQLFDLQNDPDELTNVADKPEHAQQIKSLTAEMEHWQHSLGDTTPLVVAQPQDPRWDPSQRPETPPGKAKGKNQKS